MKKHKVVKFKIKSFGLLEEGTFINAYLIAEEKSRETGLLYVPPDKNGCGCLIWAIHNIGDYYTDYDNPLDNFVNLSGNDFFDPDFKRLLKSEFKVKDLKYESS